jgi:hypothetical protein
MAREGQFSRRKQVLCYTRLLSRKANRRLGFRRPEAENQVSTRVWTSVVLQLPISEGFLHRRQRRPLRKIIRARDAIDVEGLSSTPP